MNASTIQLSFWSVSELNLAYEYRSEILFQGVLGIKVKIMLDWDPKGKQGPVTPLPDLVTTHPPKEEELYVSPAPNAATEVEIAVE